MSNNSFAPNPGPPASQPQQNVPVPSSDHPLVMPSSGGIGPYPVPPPHVPMNVSTLPRPPPPPSTPIRAPAASTTAPPLPSVVSPPVPASVTLDNLTDDFLSPEGSDNPTKPAALRQDLSDINRLRYQVKQRAWGDVLRTTESFLRGKSTYAPLYLSLLQQPSQQQELLSLETQQADLVYILSVHCQALLRMRRHADLELEIDRWTFLHHNDNHAPDWIPWSVHIMAASTLLYTNTSGEEAIDALWTLCQDIPDKDAVAKLHVEHVLCNAFTHRRQWRMAMATLQRILDLLPAACERYAKSIKVPAQYVEAAYHIRVMSRQGAIFLQLGAIDEAAEVFAQAKAQRRAASSCGDGVVAQTPAQLDLNEGLLRFAYGNHHEALDFFRSGIEYLRKNALPMEDATFLFEAALGMEPAHILYGELMNNMAICALYTCRLREALSLTESLVRESPAHYLTERVARNLCTLYELSNETTASSRKKRVLQLVSKRFHLHDINPSSFRL